MDMRWSAAVGVVAGTAPVADDASAYVVTRTPDVVAIDLATGAIRWHVATPTALAPAVGAGLAFVVVSDGVQAVHAADGTLAWHRPLESGVAAPPSVAAGQVVVSLASGEIVALRATDGAPLWRTPLGSIAHAAPISAVSRWYLTLADGRLVALDAGSGQPIWTRALGGRATGVLRLDDQIVIGTTDGFLLSLDPREGRLRWQWRLGTPVAGTPAADARHIYVVGFDHLLRALDRRSGNLRWRQALPHRPASGPVLAGDTVLVPSLSTEIASFAAATGAPGHTIASTSEVGSAMYFLSAGEATGTRLLAVTTDGELVAFSSRIEAAPTALTDLPGTRVVEPAPVQPPPEPTGGRAR